jgi:hypothetical protein
MKVVFLQKVDVAIDNVGLKIQTFSPDDGEVDLMLAVAQTCIKGRLAKEPGAPDPIPDPPKRTFVKQKEPGEDTPTDEKVAAMVLEAMGDMIEAGNVTNAGMPDVAALENLVRERLASRFDEEAPFFNITASERTELFEANFKGDE